MKEMVRLFQNKTKGEKPMMDVYMAAALAAIFGLFYAFANWCESIVEENGREES
jgi:hypothetical protein